MPITREEITAGATYTVRVSLVSDQYFQQAVSLIKGIGQRKNSAAVYDSSSKTWTVTLSPTANRALADLREAVSRYGVTAERA